MHRPADGCARRSLTQSRPENRRMKNAVTKPVHNMGQRCFFFAFIVAAGHSFLSAGSAVTTDRLPPSSSLTLREARARPGLGCRECRQLLYLPRPEWRPSKHAPGARMKMTTRGKMADGHSPVALHSLAWT